MSRVSSKFNKSYLREEVEKKQDGYLSELREMYKNSSCVDCGNSYTGWATLKRGKFVCISCAQKLRADCSNKVKSCGATYIWCEDEMEKMRKNWYK